MDNINGKIDKYFRFEKILNKRNIEDFVNLTQDKNNIHNSKFYKNPIVPGFQLDSLIETYGNEIMISEKNEACLNKMDIKFNNFTRSGNKIYIDFDYTKLENSSNLIAKVYDDYNTLVTADLNYKSDLPVIMEEFENNSFKKKISLNKEKINNFKKSLCEEYASNSNEFPNLLIPSMSSKVITKSIKKYIKEETMPVYLKHKINFYNCKRDILNNFYINLKDHKVLRGDSIHKFKLSGSNCRSKLFDVELLLGIVNDNKLKNQE